MKPGRLSPLASVDCGRWRRLLSNQADRLGTGASRRSNLGLTPDFPSFRPPDRLRDVKAGEASNAHSLRSENFRMLGAKTVPVVVVTYRR